MRCCLCFALGLLALSASVCAQKPSCCTTPCASDTNGDCQSNDCSASTPQSCFCAYRKDDGTGRLLGPCPSGYSACCDTPPPTPQPEPTPRPPTPPPTPQPEPYDDHYACVDNQCVPRSGGSLSKATCAAMCIQLFVCSSNTCTASSTGVPQDECEPNCGHALRGALAAK